MESTHDSRKSEDAAVDKTAVTGGNGTKEPARGGAPRSWRQYIEQSMPAQDTGAETERVRPVRRQWRTGTSWKRFVRRTARQSQERGRKARTAAAACRKKVGEAAVACRKKLGPAAAAYRKRLGGAAAVCRKNLGPAAAACRAKLASAVAAARKKLEPAAASAREKLSPAAAVCREKLGRSVKKARAAVARHPISPLLYVTLLAVFIGVAAFQGNYARAYVLEVNGQRLGLVSGEDEANAILGNVETRAASLLGGDFDYEMSVTLSPVYAAPGDLTDAAEMENALFEGVGGFVMAPVVAVNGNQEPDPDDGGSEEVLMTVWVLSVDGEDLAIATDKDALYQILDEVAQPYLPENAVRYEFVEDVQVYSVELPLNTELDDLEAVREELSSLRVEEAVYVVKKGDTFNAIAYSLGMRPYQLAAINPDVIVDKLRIGQKLTIQQAVPRLSVLAVAEETYEQVISSPVEYVGTPDLYVGDTRLKEQGEDGLALVSALVTYYNNVEQDREILESTTLKEATTTYTYSGTTPRPSTASNGYFIWPVRGTITSNFGYRYIFGSNSYHSGIDIGVSTGTAIKAADGGKVTFAGWQGSYGYLVIITHDDGKQTYYGHNSSLLVKAGERVYQGQTIALSGATGNVTGPHCHFEVRVNGTSVNPRNYLK